MSGLLATFVLSQNHNLQEKTKYYQTLKRKQMKKLILVLFSLVLVNQLLAQTTIYTKDGRTFNLPINANEILRIEFSSTPVTQAPGTETQPQVSNSFIGKWLRKEGGTIAEYMEIKQGNTEEFEINFRGTDNGKITFKGIGILQNGEIKSKFTQGSKRKFNLLMNGKNEIGYN